MASEDFDRMFDVDLNTLQIFLSTKARRTALSLDEFIETALAQGSTKEELRKELLRDLEEGGRIFGEFRSAVRATSNGTMNRIRDTAQFSEDYKVTHYRWIAVFVNTCPDCMERHGEVKTMDEWEEAGLPRAGFTVCKDNCKCTLIDADTAILKPIKREKR